MGAVAAARADHLALKGAIAPLDAVAPAVAGPVAAAPALGYAAAPVAYAGYAPYAAGYAPYAAGYAPYAAGYAGYAPYAYGYAGPLNLNTQLIAHPNGAVVPVDEPAVAAARAAHLDTQAAEYAASAPIVAAAPLVAAAPT